MASLVPFGLGMRAHHPSVDLSAALWENRDALPRAWRVLTDGICDGCGIAEAGILDSVVEGPHLCVKRLRRLRDHTIGPLAPVAVADMDRLRAMSRRQLRALGRLQSPYLYRPGDRGPRRLSWTEAMTALTDALSGIDPDRMAFLASPDGPANEACYAFGKAARIVGCPHINVADSTGHQAVMDGLQRTLGLGSGTCTLSDLPGTDLILLFGGHIGDDQPMMLRYLLEAKRRGARLVVVHPHLDRHLDRTWIATDGASALFGSELADDHIRVSPGGTAAFLTGVLKAVLEISGEDLAFITAHTEGFPELAEAIPRRRWRALERRAGVRRRDMAWVGELICRANTVLSIWGSPTGEAPGQHTDIGHLVNLHLATGTLGARHSGVLAITGRAGSQGARDVGVHPDRLPTGLAITPGTAAALAASWGVAAIPDQPGHDLDGLRQAADARGLDALFAMGPLDGPASAPRPPWYVALPQVPVRVHLGTLIDSSMLVEPGGLLLWLPVLDRHEHPGGGTMTSSDRRVRFAPALPRDHPIGDARAVHAAIATVADTLHPGAARALEWTDTAAIRVEMARIIPTYTRIRQLRERGDAFQWGGPRLCRRGWFPDMPTGRARFTTPEGTP